jgi:uncharacterized protein (DUF1684 family)
MARPAAPCRRRPAGRDRGARPWRAALLLGLGLAASAGGDSTTHADSVQAWRAARETRLQSERGWLTMVALHPLPPGRHSVGDADSDLPFPAGAPERIGWLTVGEELSFEPAPGVGVRVAGDSTAIEGRLRLRSDADAAGPVRLQLDRFTWWIIDRDGALFLRLSDRHSPFLREFRGLSHFPVDEAWRVRARLRRPPAERVMEIPTILGTTSATPSAGWLEFDLAGATHRLEVPADEGGYFVIFGDATNGETTYGAGRFLWVEGEADDDGHVWLDFNRAYNPPCAFTPYATCPLPPAGNRLPVAVTAGERTYAPH